MALVCPAVDLDGGAVDLDGSAVDLDGPHVVVDVTVVDIGGQSVVIAGVDVLLGWKCAYCRRTTGDRSLPSEKDGRVLVEVGMITVQIFGISCPVKRGHTHHDICCV